MRSILALATFALVALVMEEKARQLAEDAQHAVGEAVTQAQHTKDTVRHKVEDQPLIAVLVAAAVGYVLSKIVPVRP
jgi:ElaB/YqjD/DUF883 family membrane-anchored ribosome-binding protein